MLTMRFQHVFRCDGLGNSPGNVSNDSRDIRTGSYACDTWTPFDDHLMWPATDQSSLTSKLPTFAGLDPARRAPRGDAQELSAAHRGAGDGRAHAITAHYRAGLGGLSVLGDAHILKDFTGITPCSYYRTCSYPTYEFSLSVVVDSGWCSSAQAGGR